MNTQITMHVLSVKRGEVDGNRYASLMMVSDTPTYERDSAGLQVMKVTCDYDLLDRIDSRAVPGNFIAEVALVTAAGGKAGFKVLQLQPVKKA